MKLVNDSMQTPPPLERHSAEKFRLWLAGMVSQDKPATTTDRDDMKAASVAILAACPEVYGLADRMSMWEKVGNAAAAALETCDGDLVKWVNEIMQAIDAPPGDVARCKRLGDAVAAIEDRPDWWKVECLRVIRDLRFTLPILARKAWKKHQEETGTQYKGGLFDGDK